MNEIKILSDSLMEDAAVYFVNLKNTGNWNTEVAKNAQIIAFTTQISALETKASTLLTERASTGQPMTPTGGDVTGGSNSGNYTFELWRLKKVDNKADHNMIEQDGNTWYWCNDHTYNNKGVVT